MARHRNHRVIITPPPKPPPPAPAPEKFDLADFLMRAAVVGLCVVDFVAALSWLDARTLPALGTTCWTIERATSDGRRRDVRCEPSEGFHAKRRASDGTVWSVPDDARPIYGTRRYEAADGR